MPPRGNYHYVRLEVAVSRTRPERAGIMLYLMDQHSRDVRTNTRKREREREEGVGCVDSIYEGRVNIYPVRFLKCPDLQ